MINDLISREALKETINSNIAQATKVGIIADADYLWSLLNYAIDNAPTVDIKDQIAGAYNEGYICGNREAEKARLQGECRTCRHRDPEDKKCDCGGLERHGCSFPVSDDYFCKFYEKVIKNEQ